MRGTAPLQADSLANSIDNMSTVIIAMADSGALSAQVRGLNSGWLAWQSGLNMVNGGKL